MLASRIHNLKESPVRELLKQIGTPGMISFAGGLPSADCFPELDLAGVKPEKLQYGASEGDLELRNKVADLLTERGVSTDPDRVLILSGSQQGIDLVAKLLIESGTKVAVETPTYLAALQVFDLFGANYAPICPSSIEVSGARLVYTNPTFQNPTGHCYSQQQRHELASACDNSGAVLFEDDPYRDLVYDQCSRTPICSYLRHSEWIYQSSFSKSIAPGLRLGYLTASETLFPHLVRLKQAADLHSCRISQAMITQLLSMENHSYREIASYYKDRRDTFDELLSQMFEDIAVWQIPTGGLFFWLQLKPHLSIDTRTILGKSINNGVAFMPGEYFYPKGIKPVSSLRLNFSNACPNQAAIGLSRLADIIRYEGTKPE